MTIFNKNKNKEREKKKNTEKEFFFIVSVSFKFLPYKINSLLSFFLFQVTTTAENGGNLG